MDISQSCWKLDWMMDGISFSAMRCAWLSGNLLIKGSSGWELSFLDLPCPSSFRLWHTHDGQRWSVEGSCMQAPWSTQGKAKSLLQHSCFQLSMWEDRHFCLLPAQSLLWSYLIPHTHTSSVASPCPTAGLLMSPICALHSPSRFLPSACWVVVLMFLCFHQQISICQDLQQILPQHLA